MRTGQEAQTIDNTTEYSLGEWAHHNTLKEKTPFTPFTLSPVSLIPKLHFINHFNILNDKAKRKVTGQA